MVRVRRNWKRLAGWLALGSFWMVPGDAPAQQYGPPAGTPQRFTVRNNAGGFQTFESNMPTMGNTQPVPQSIFSRHLYPDVRGLSIPGNRNRFPGTPLMYGMGGAGASSTYGGVNGSTAGGGGGGGGGGGMPAFVRTPGPVITAPNQLPPPLYGMPVYVGQPLYAIPSQELFEAPRPSSGDAAGNGPMGLGNGPVVPFNGPGNLAGPMPAFEREQTQPQAQSKSSRSQAKAKAKAKAKSRTSTKAQPKAAATPARDETPKP